jgi:hypothetical protein
MKQADSPLKSPSRKDSPGNRQDLSNRLSRCPKWRGCRNLPTSGFLRIPAVGDLRAFYINRDPHNFQSNIAHQSSPSGYAILQTNLLPAETSRPGSDDHTVNAPHYCTSMDRLYFSRLSIRSIGNQVRGRRYSSSSARMLPPLLRFFSLQSIHLKQLLTLIPLLN